MIKEQFSFIPKLIKDKIYKIESYDFSYIEFLDCRFLGYKNKDIAVFLDEKNFQLIYFSKESFVTEKLENPVGKDLNTTKQYYLNVDNYFFNFSIDRVSVGKYQLCVEFPSGRTIKSELDLIPKIKEMIESDDNYKQSVEI